MPAIERGEHEIILTAISDKKKYVINIKLIVKNNPLYVEYVNSQ